VKDEEIFACYRFKFAIGPLWFKKNLLEFLKENPEGTECSKSVTNGMTIQEMKENYEASLKLQNI